MIATRTAQTVKTAIAFLLFSTIFIGCKKEETTVSNDTYFFTGNVDNASIRWDVKAFDNISDTSRYHSWAHYFTSQWPIDCATSDCNDLAAGTGVTERYRGNGINVLLLQATKSIDLNQLQTLFTPGFKSYGKQRTSPYIATQNGVLITFTENGRTWRSEIGDQTGSTFELIEFKEAIADKNVYSHVWRARFSCKVYFTGLPPRVLQNCEIYGPAFRK